MAYNQFKVERIVEQFGIKIHTVESIFDCINPLPISEHLKQLLDENLPLALAIHTEKARSEMIVAPILVELRKLKKHQISLFSGTELNVDKSQGLKGVCDFIVSQSNQQLFLTAPIIALVEAKKDNIQGGIGQCMAEMIGSQLFNQQKGTAIKTIYGVVTTGSNWKFMKLEGTDIFIETGEIYIEEIERILGILVKMVS